MLLEILEELVIIGTLRCELKFYFHALLAHFTKDIELEGVSFVGLVVDVLKLDSDPVLEALSVHEAVGTNTTTGSYVCIFVEFFVVAAEATLYHLSLIHI